MVRALLIDDEEIALDVMEILLLEVGGVEVLGKFRLLSEALAFPGLQPDLIFLDIEMPGTNGLAAAEKLHARFPSADIIYVTAHHQYAVDAFETKAIGYLLKPVAKQKLLRVLERHAELRTRTAGADLPPPEGSEDAPGEFPNAALKLKLLGSMELYDSEGRLVTWRTKKAKELFAFLWHHDGEPVYRHRIIDQLWPEMGSERAQSLFHTTMYYLRKALKAAGCPDRVEFGDERYWLRTEGVDCDVAQLELAVRNGGRIDELLALYRGDYLETESYGWAEGRRYELRAAYIQRLEQLCEEADSLTAKRILRRLIDLDPYREQHYGRLERLLRDQGEFAEADKLVRLQEQTLAELGLTSGS